MENTTLPTNLPSQLSTSLAPAVPTDAPKPVFDSLEDERAYYFSQAERFKTQLNQQVHILQEDTTASVKRAVTWGGSYLLCYGIARTLLGTHKHTVHTPEGPVRLSEKESVMASAVKGAVLLGLGVFATNVARRVIAKRLALHHEQDPSLEQDPTEL
jgi:hypothetical protein